MKAMGKADWCWLLVLLLLVQIVVIPPCTYLDSWLELYSILSLVILLPQALVLGVLLNLPQKWRTRPILPWLLGVGLVTFLLFGVPLICEAGNYQSRLWQLKESCAIVLMNMLVALILLPLVKKWLRS